MIDALLEVPDRVVPVAGLALSYPEAKEPLSARLVRPATVHTDRYDTQAVERELDAYGARRGKDWVGDKVKRYGVGMRGASTRMYGTSASDQNCNSRILSISKALSGANWVHSYLRCNLFA